MGKYIKINSKFNALLCGEAALFKLMNLEHPQVARVFSYFSVSYCPALNLFGSNKFCSKYARNITCLNVWYARGTLSIFGLQNTEAQIF